MGPGDQNIVVRQTLFAQVPHRFHENTAGDFQPRGQVLRLRVPRTDRILQSLQRQRNQFLPVLLILVNEVLEVVPVHNKSAGRGRKVFYCLQLQPHPVQEVPVVSPGCYLSQT